ncbi:hypothetical protein AB8B02_05815 [Tardiphaga sp. 862_B3_N4_1]|uniref:hypothetical protein n=1 Tax=Tardiphaga sp. 862_B3_N4_1 TaxID=3240764 RepID=UPI003F1E7A1C
MKMRYLAAVAWLALASPALAAQGSGCLPTTGTVSGLSMTQFINQALQALISGNSGASAPATDCTAVPIKGQTWLDTSVTPNVERRYDGNSWVAVGAIDATNHVWSPPIGGGNASITAAATTDICAAPSGLQTVTGTTTITSFGSGCPVGVIKKLIFNSATPLTYNATSMILPGQRDYVATAGDLAEALHLGAGNWRVAVAKIDGSAVTNPATPVGTVFYGQWGTIPVKTVYGTGQAISRATYPDYFAAATRVQSGTLTAGNTTITSVANTAGLGAGMPLEGVGIPAGTTIVSVTSSTIVMSGTGATANGSQSIRAFITGYGSGGDSTTVGVTNCVGKTIAGRDPSATNLDAASALNTSQGAKNRLIDQSQLPNVGLSVAVSGTVTVQSLDGGIVNGSVLHHQGDPGGSSGYYDKLADGSAAGDFRTSQGFNSMTGGASSINGGVTQIRLPTVQPTVIAECVVAVLP